MHTAGHADQSIHRGGRAPEDATTPAGVSASTLNSPTAALHLGRASALACLVLSTTYVLAQVAEWLGWLGSGGGPHSRSTPLGLALLLTPSLLLASAFVMMMVSIHHSADTSRRVWSHAAVVFATIYAVLVSLVYFVQLTFVMPRLARGDAGAIALLVFEPFDSFLYAVDILGYGMMCLSLLFSAAVFAPQGRARWIRGALWINGALTPFLLLQMYFPWLIYGASVWSVAFPATCALLAADFHARLATHRH